MPHNHIKHIPMKYPGVFAIQFENDLVFNPKGSKPESRKLPEHLVVIPGEVDHLGVPGEQSRDMLYHLHVGLWPETLRKLPHIDDISVENQFFGPDGFKVAKELFG